MKFYIKLFILILLVSCREEKPVKIIINPIQNEQSGNNAGKSANRVEADEFRLICDSAYINNKWFKACWGTSERAFVLNDENDTLYSEKEGIWHIKFNDFNEDGYKDMFVGYNGNYIAYELGLFDYKTNNFKLVKGFSSYRDTHKLKGTNYYYSYSSGGCADLNWYSILFYINDYVAYSIGQIEGIGCEQEEKNGIFVSKITEGKEILVKSIPREPGYYADKWDFIQKYWLENYKAF
ncbi:hypothetical protein OGH69_16355 [Flavobacterium sp. MFBS3-15]|uniref:hypothetical protein n=1 Tax=Flavobacterium sp. MFBS3-15 TaxID=2989816 RepID=UPI0022359976|nr:hypothetical protein [Flavobacterium sp. MFBS3-15]MCW4470544.1 hypothetical protein [Flavobacterium sp. MFBS3-15]